MDIEWYRHGFLINAPSPGEPGMEQFDSGKNPMPNKAQGTVE